MREYFDFFFLESKDLTDWRYWLSTLYMADFALFLAEALYAVGDGPLLRFHL